MKENNLRYFLSDLDLKEINKNFNSVSYEVYYFNFKACNIILTNDRFNYVTNLGVNFDELVVFYRVVLQGAGGGGLG